MCFILFEYYLTWQTAPEGIKPGLQRIADDLGLEKNAVCNLRAKLVKSGWIEYKNEEVFIKKSFTKNESDSQKMNDDSQKMNESFTKNEQMFTKNESPYKEENKQEKEQLETTFEKQSAGGSDAPSQIGRYGQPFQSLSSNAVNRDSELLLNSWLDAVAVAVGAKTRYTMADYSKWQQTCAKALDDGRSLSRMLEVIAAERKRLDGQMQFFTPGGVLRILQTEAAAPTVSAHSPPDLIKNCKLCDERGMMPYGDGVKKCTHEKRENYERQPDLAKQTAAVQPGR